MSECIFCRIVNGRTDTEFVYEDDAVVVFRDIHPQAPIHMLIVPRRHIRSINDLTDEQAPVLGRMFLAAKAVAAQQQVAQSGYKLMLNVERGGGQLIFHIHLHLIGGWGR